MADSVELDIIILINRHRNLAAQMKPMEDELETIRSQLRPLVEAIGGKWQDETGYARVVQRAPSVSYDTKGLDALRASSDDLARILNPHRKEKPGADYLQVK